MRSNPLLGGMVAVLLLLLAGCTAPAADPPPTSEVPVSMPDPAVLSGTGLGEIELDIPEGVQSLTTRVVCTEGLFNIGANVHMTQTPMGACHGMVEVDLPLSESSPMRVSISVFPESPFVAEFEFSTAELDIDPAIARDCEVLGVVLSGAYNADAGFTAGDLDGAAWQAEVDAAALPLEGMDPSPMIATQHDALVAWFASATTPGDFTTATTPEANEARNLVNQICTGNNSGLLLMGEYGG